MFTRGLAIMVAPCLPAAALIFPLGTTHRISALVSGTLAVVLSAFALSNDRARFGAAIVGGWVALTALIFPSTLLEQAVADAPRPATTGDGELPLAA